MKKQHYQITVTMDFLKKIPVMPSADSTEEDCAGCVVMLGIMATSAKDTLDYLSDAEFPITGKEEQTFIMQESDFIDVREIEVNQIDFECWPEDIKLKFQDKQLDEGIYYTSGIMYFSKNEHKKPWWKFW